MADINPLVGIFDEFSKILNQMVIKYSGKAESEETYTSKSHADKYMAAYMNRDSYDTYIGSYTKDDFKEIGIQDPDIIDIYVKDNSLIPDAYHRKLFKIHHDNFLATYEDYNNYYRTLDGYPKLNDNEHFYISKEYHDRYGIPNDVPIHKLEDVYGVYYINLVEGLGILKKLRQDHPDKEYLNYIGSKRIPIEKSRTAKNFEIIYLNQGTIGNVSFDSFKNIYTQCREYFMSVIYIKEYRNVIPYYDNFIALCIFVMTMQQVTCRQLNLEIHREFFSIQALQQLYQAYGIPYDLTIDEYTQKSIAENINLLIQAKSTDKVLYDIASILGYNNMDVYKYYLVKERKFDTYGLPVVKTKNEVDRTTGNIETVYDYESMYDIYFRKVNLKNQNIYNVFSKNSSRVEYDEITTNDPYWFEDTELYESLWKSEYNFVESKYFGLSVSYRMSEMIYENVMLLHMLMDKKSPLSDIHITIPKIMPKMEITLFEAVILLCAIISKKYNLYGEVVTTPTQLMYLLDTWDQDRINRYNKYDDRGLNIIDILGFNFKLFDNPNYKDQFQEVYDLLGKEDGDKLFEYLTILSKPLDGSKTEKIQAINDMYSSIKGLSKFIDLRMTETSDRQVYEALRDLYDICFYKEESDEVFKVTIDGKSQVASTYFEFLYYENPALYNAVFDNSIEAQYNAYIEENSIDGDVYTLDQFRKDLESEKIEYRFDIFTKNNPFIGVTDNLIYYFIDHIVSQMETVIKGLNFIYLIADTASPIEELLMKMVNYFKSFTVDAISLSTLFIMDMKVTNMLKFMDEVERIGKTIEVTEDKHLSYSDVIHNMTDRILVNTDSLNLKDRYIYNSLIYINELFDNHIFKFDEVHKILKENQYNESFTLTDALITITSKFATTDKSMGLRDSVYVKEINE